MTTTRGRLAGKVILVTGASRNIGGTVAAAYAAEGASVACNDLDPDVAAECAGTIAAAGGRAIAVSGDVTDPASVNGMVAEIRDSLGEIDVLLNNAAVFQRGGILTMDVGDFRRQLDVIVTGAFITTQAVARPMVAAGTGGNIITVLSTAAWQGEAGNIGYSTAKSALVNFTRSAATELAPHGIRVNSFTPTVTVPRTPRPSRSSWRGSSGSGRRTGWTSKTRCPGAASRPRGTTSGASSSWPLTTPS